MQKQLEEMCVLMRHLIKKQKKTLKMLWSLMPPEETDLIKSAPKSSRLSKAEKLKKKALKKKLPKYPTTQQTIDALKTISSNFYRNVYKKELHPVYPNGKQPHYRRSEVIKLAISVVHEPGAHTYSKLDKKDD